MAWRVSQGQKGKLYQSEVMGVLSFALSRAIRLQVLMNCSPERYCFVSGPLRTSQTQHRSEILPPQHSRTGTPTGQRTWSMKRFRSSYHSGQSPPGNPGPGSGASRYRKVVLRGPGGGCGQRCALCRLQQDSWQLPACLPLSPPVWVGRAKMGGGQCRLLTGLPRQTHPGGGRGRQCGRTGDSSEPLPESSF